MPLSKLHSSRVSCFYAFRTHCCEAFTGGCIIRFVMFVLGSVGSSLFGGRAESSTHLVTPLDVKHDGCAVKAY